MQDPHPFTNADEFSPVYCTACGLRIPKTLSNTNQGLCNRCVGAATRSHIGLAAQAPQSAAQFAQAFKLCPGCGGPSGLCAGFCATCGQPFRTPVALPRLMTPQTTPQNILGVVLMWIGGVVTCCWILIFLVGAFLGQYKGPPSPTGELTMGMSEDAAISVMGRPWSREVNVALTTQRGQLCWTMAWSQGGADNLTATTGNFSPDGLVWGSYMTKSGKFFLLDSEHEGWYRFPP